MKESLFLTMMLSSVPIPNPPAYPVPQMENPEMGRWGQLEQGTPGTGPDVVTGSTVCYCVTNSLSSPQFSTPESLLRLLLMVQERLWVFLLKMSRVMENLPRDADKQEPW